MRALALASLLTAVPVWGLILPPPDDAQARFDLGLGLGLGESASAVPATGAGAEQFDGDCVWRVRMDGVDEVERAVVREAFQTLGIDIWRQSPTQIDFRAASTSLPVLTALLPAPLRLYMLHPNVTELVSNSYISPLSPDLLPYPAFFPAGSGTHAPLPALSDAFHEAYHPLADVYAFGSRLVAAVDGVVLGEGKLRAETFVLGQTWEERDIKGFRVKWVRRPKAPRPTGRPTEPLPTGTETMTETDTATSTETPAPAPTETPGVGVWDEMGEWAEWAEDEWAGMWKRGHGHGEKKGKKGKGKKGKKGKHGKHGKGKKGKGGKGKKKELIEREFVVQSGSHAREWVGPSSAIYFLHSLLVAGLADHESEEATLLKSFTFTVIPTINPDGYEYSRQHRLWRKNRQGVSSDICSGIDLNTNWGYKWQPPGSTSACSDAYPGTAAFEAYETRAVADYLANGTEWSGHKHKGKGKDQEPERVRKVRAFVDLHSYGQLFMYPYAYSCDDFPSDAEMLLEAGLGVAKAMRTDHGETYQSGQACELTYRAPGDAIDYAYGVADIRWSYSAELRDTGTYGFLLPPSLIRPTADEISTGLVHLAKFIYNTEVVEHQ